MKTNSCILRPRTRLALLAGFLACTAGLPAVAGQPRPLPPDLRPWFSPPPEFRGQFGDYRSPLLLPSGRRIQNEAEWQRHRQEILDRWHGLMGRWPEILTKPAVTYLQSERRENLMQHKVRVEVAPGWTRDAYLLVPDLEGPLPAALVVYYDPATGVGLKGELRDFAYQLAKRGFVALSLGSGSNSNYYPDEKAAVLQPLSLLAYMAANCYHALANLPQVDPKRVGVVGHSYGGKWAMFASCLYDKFALGVWSDGGVVFDETRGNVNFWSPWYLGYDPNATRPRGIPNEQRPRTGAYKRMRDEGWDLHELHALMAPRPFLVSGGAEDRSHRWLALNHAVEVNRLLGYENRVAMHNRPTHSPNPESNEVIYRFFEHFLK